MPKIKPTHAIVEDGYLYIIDDNGNLWSKNLPDGDWESVGSLPEEPDDGRMINDVDPDTEPEL